MCAFSGPHELAIGRAAPERSECVVSGVGSKRMARARSALGWRQILTRARAASAWSGSAHLGFADVYLLGAARVNDQTRYARAELWRV